MGIVEIYALSCPDTNEVRYIGKANNSAKRLKSHIRDSRTRDTPVYRWFRKLALQGKVPTIQVIATIEPGYPWQQVEKNLIIKYRSEGARLLNVAEGGDEPFCSPEQRAANGRATAMLIHSDPKRKRVWELKRYMGRALNEYRESGRKDAHNRILAKLHLAAAKAPHLFGEYARISPMI